MLLPYGYTVTKYDPDDYGSSGYEGPEDSMSDHGPKEAAYLAAVEVFAEVCGITELTIRDPGVTGFVNFGLEAPIPGHGLAGLFPDDLTGFHDGARVPLSTGVALVKAMLRDHGVWCRLDFEDRFLVQVGYDQYMYIGSSEPCDEAVERTRALGLFPVPARTTMWDFDDDDDPPPGPADEAFWNAVADLVRERGSVLLEEIGVANASRWHRLRTAEFDELHPRLTPRAGLLVWPELDIDVQEVLRAIRDDDERSFELVWEDRDGLFHKTLADSDDYPGLYPRLAQARGAMANSFYAHEYHPLLVAVLPDDDGVVRSRWRL